MARTTPRSVGVTVAVAVGYPPVSFFLLIIIIYLYTYRQPVLMKTLVTSNFSTK